MKYEKKPKWLKVKINTNKSYNFLKSIISTDRLNTVCEEAKCPNIHECWGEHGTATFMILGDTCTRRCRFCSVKTGMPHYIDELEPVRVAETVRKLKLTHSVITMVNRDDLEDGGALIMSHTVNAIRAKNFNCTIEILTSDFMGKRSSLETVLKSNPDIMSHNLETVERLTPFVRSRSSYKRSLEVLRMSRELNKDIMIKSSLMLGLGETKAEIIESMRDMLEHNVQVLNLGQYLQPTTQHLAVKKYWTPEEFDELKKNAMDLGFLHCESAPFVRSSYHAGLSYEEMRRKIHPLYKNG